MSELIKAQKRGDHYVVPVSPAAVAVPFAARSVPMLAALPLTHATGPALRTHAHVGPLVVTQASVVPPTPLTLMHTITFTEGDATRPVEGSPAIYHKHAALINGPKWKMKPGLVNAGVLPGKLECGAKLKAELDDLVDQFADAIGNDPLACSAAMAGGAVTGLGLGAWDFLKGIGSLITGVSELSLSTLKAEFDALRKAMEGLSAAQIKEVLLDELMKFIEQLGCGHAEALAASRMKGDSPCYMLGHVVGQLGFDVLLTVGTGGVGAAARGASAAGKLARVADGAGEAGGFLRQLRRGFERKRNAPDARGNTPRTTPPPNRPAETVKPAPVPPPCPIACGAQPKKGPLSNPVNPILGQKLLAGDKDLDFDLPAVLPLPWQRTYCSGNRDAGVLGQGWTLPIGTFIRRNTALAEHAYELVDTFGRALPFVLPADGEPWRCPWEQLVYRRLGPALIEVADPQDGLRMLYAPPDVGPDNPRGETSARWVHVATLDANDNQIRLIHDEAGRVRYILDSAGRILELKYEDGFRPAHEDDAGVRLIAVIHHAGRSLQRGRLVQLADSNEAEPRLLVAYVYSAEGDLIEVRNALRETVRVFAWRNHILTEQGQPGGLVSRYVYDDYSPSGRVVRAEANDGQSATLHYEPHQTRVVDHLGRSQLFHFDDDQNWLGTTDAHGQRNHRTLGPHRELLAEVDALGRRTSYTVDRFGNVTSITAPDGAVTQLAWDEAGQKLIAITDPLGHTVRYAYDLRGNRVAETDPLGRVTRYEFDRRGLPIRITDAHGKDKRLAWNDAGQLTEYVDCSGRATRYRHDTRGNLIGIIDAAGQSTLLRYDALDRLRAVQWPDGTVESLDYDPLGRLIEHTDGEGHSTHYTLALDGLPIERRNALGHSLRYRYDAARRLVALVNENGEPYHFAYDALDRLVAETDLDGRITRYRYDPVGRLLEKLEYGTAPDPRKVRADRTQVDPDNAADAANDGETGEAAPAAADDLPDEAARSTPTLDDPWGRQDIALDALFTPPPGAPLIRSRFAYDAADRLIEQTTSDGRPGHARRTRLSYDLAGRLTDARILAGHGAHIRFDYDAADQLTAEQSTLDGARRALTHSYDALGNRIRTLLPEGFGPARRIDWLFYGSGHLHQIALDGEVLCDIERDALHRETLRTQGALESRYAWDPMGRLLAQTAERRRPGLPPRPTAGAAGGEAGPGVIPPKSSAPRSRAMRPWPAAVLG